MELQGNGFVLRGWLMNDALSLQQHANNPRVVAYLLDRFPSPYTLDEAVRWVAAWQSQNPLTNFAIAVEDKVVGGIGLDRQQDIYRKTVLLGYWLSEQYWGRGIVTQAVQLVTAYAFEELEAICVQAKVLSKNPASMRVLEKAGFRQQGILEKSVIKNGEVLDEHLYAAFRP